MTQDRRANLMLRKFIELWPLWVALAGGIVACFKFYFTVSDLAMDQALWRANSEQRREHMNESLEDIRTRLTKLERDNDWLRRERGR